jgi:hypothetical protein
MIDGNVARFKLLLGDIRDVFTKQDNAPISSAELVKALVAIEGRPWGKTSNPLTQIRLARLLARMQIRPGCIGPEATRVRGYKRTQFTGALKRYLPPCVDAPVMASANGTGRPSASRGRDAAASFDHLVGDGEQRRRHFEAERSGSSSVHWREIDYAAFLFLKPRLLIVADFL